MWRHRPNVAPRGIIQLRTGRFVVETREHGGGDFGIGRPVAPALPGVSFIDLQWIFTVMFALAEMTSAIQTPLGYAKAISAWFDRRRGLALGIAMSGVGLGAFVVPQLAERLIERVGWRGAYVSLGLLTLVIAFPAVALWIREPRPGEGERGRLAAIAVLPGHTVREAASTARFWMLGATFFLVAIAINGSAAHIVPLLTDHGLSAASATATLAVFGLATMSGRLLAGFLVDRIFAPYVATLFFLAPIAGFAFLASATGMLPAAGVVLMGMGLGTEIDLIAFLVTRYFGQRAFGQIYGYFFMTPRQFSHKSMPENPPSPGAPGALGTVAMVSCNPSR